MISISSARALASLALVATASFAHARNVVLNDSATMNLSLRSFSGASVALPGVEATNVTRGMWITLGTLPSGGSIQARWDEIADSLSSKVVFQYRTSDGRDLFPATLDVGGMPAFFWNYEHGLLDAVAFTGGRQEVELLSARLITSRNGGVSVYSDSDITTTLGPTWNGRDAGVRQSRFGAGINSVEIVYQLRVIPAPGAIALGVLAVPALVRRRR